MQQSVRVGRTARNVNIDWDDGIDTANRGVVDAEDAAAATACADGNDEPRVRHGVVGLSERQLHIAGNRAGDEQHISVAGRGHEMNPETFEVVDRAGQAHNLDFAAVAGTGVNFSDMQGAAKGSVNARFELFSDGCEGGVGIARKRRRWR